jgi:hypothetical protein
VTLGGSFNQPFLWHRIAFLKLCDIFFSPCPLSKKNPGTRKLLSPSIYEFIIGKISSHLWSHGAISSLCFQIIKIFIIPASSFLLAKPVTLNICRSSVG